MNKIYLLIGLAFVASCAELNPPDVAPPVDAVEEALLDQPPPPPMNAVTVEQFDTTSDADREAALETPAPSGEREIGRTVASLGNPADPGFWMETPLVSVETEGRVVYPSTGNSVTLKLIPIDGAATAGSRISLPALRLLGAPLAGLPELIVYAG